MSNKNPKGRNTKDITKSRSRKSLQEADFSLDSSEIAYQHSVLCQTSMPFTDPGKTRDWRRDQGSTSLIITAGVTAHPHTRKTVNLGLPFGAKPRLILSYINTLALKQRSPTITVDGSLSAFIGRIQGRYPNARELESYKNQLARLATSHFQFILFCDEGRTRVRPSKIFTEFGLWFPKTSSGRILWDSELTLDPMYYYLLREHGVPLQERALAALAQSPLALDIYSWLAQRFYSMKPRRTSIPWSALKAQFGQEYKRMFHFKAKFREKLGQVLAVYQTARVELDDYGMHLRRSPTPVPQRVFAGSKQPCRLCGNPPVDNPVIG